MKTRYAIGIGVVVYFILTYFSVTVTAYRDYSFVCENTGSTKGYRQWLFVIKTGSWYKTSGLEDFIQENYPDRLNHRWTSYEGTGKNIFGQVISRGHGMPGAIFDVTFILEDWMQESDPKEILALYELLVSDMDEEIKRQKVREIIDNYLDIHNQQGINPKTPTDFKIIIPEYSGDLIFPIP